MTEDRIPYPIKDLQSDMLIKLAVIGIQDRWIPAGVAQGKEHAGLASINELTQGLTIPRR